MSINDTTPEQWDKITKPQTATGQTYYPEQYNTVNKPEHYNKGGIEAIDYIKGFNSGWADVQIDYDRQYSKYNEFDCCGLDFMIDHVIKYIADNHQIKLSEKTACYCVNEYALGCAS